MNSKPRVGSLFSGVGGFEMGFEQAGFEVAWQVEIDRDAVSVLERHYPNVPRWRDVTEVDPAELPPVDVVTFGSPCQDMSVAGKRAGLAGERSGLFYEACRIIGGLRPAPAFCLWENVPGALSSAGGRDFGAVLDALADIGALDIGWRVLDARHFGVAQRRRRVFLVADFGGQRTGQVLFESPSGDGDSAESVEAGQGSAGDVEDGTGVVGTVRSHPRPGSNSLGGVVGVPDVAFTLRHNTNGTGSSDNAWNTTYVPAVTGTLSPGAHPGGLNGQDAYNGHLIPQVARAVNCQQGIGDPTAQTFLITGTLGATDLTGNGSEETFLVANSVTASAGHHGHSSPRGDGSDNLVAVAISEDQRAATWDERNVTSKGNRSRVEYGAPSNTLHAEGLSVVIRKTTDTHEVMGYNSGIGERTYATTEARSREILCRMRETLGEEVFQQWGLGINARLQAAEVLRCDMHGEELPHSSEQVSQLVNDSLSCSEGDAERTMFGLLRAEWSRCPPHRREPYEQLTGELDAALSELPSQAAQSEAFLLALRSASEGLRLLRQALPALQEAWRSEHTRLADQEDMHGLSRTGQRSESLRSSLHASEASRNAHDLSTDVSTKEVGGLAVRRLTPRLCECERLMGWPDSWTERRADGSLIPDGPRYRLIGNGVVAPVAAWIARRLRMALESTT